MHDTHREQIGRLYEEAQKSLIDGQFEVATNKFETIIGLSKSANEPSLKDEISANCGLGATLEQSENRENAIHHYREALKIAEEIDDFEGAILALNNMGSAHEEDGEYNTAYDHYHKALIISLENKMQELEVIIRNNIGHLLISEGRIDKALVALQKSLEISRENGPIEIDILINMGTAHYKSGSVEQTVKILERAMRLCKERGLPEAEQEIDIFLQNIESIPMPIAM